MKKLFLSLIAATLFALPTHAASLSAKDCDAIAGVAKDVMESRQYGSKKYAVVNAVKDAAFGDAEAFFLELVEQAYSFPQYSTKEEKLDAIDTFTAQTLVHCYKTAVK